MNYKIRYFQVLCEDLNALISEHERRHADHRHPLGLRVIAGGKDTAEKGRVTLTQVQSMATAYLNQAGIAASQAPAMFRIGEGNILMSVEPRAQAPVPVCSVKLREINDPYASQGDSSGDIQVRESA